jgi:hypothetical protein
VLFCGLAQAAKKWIDFCYPQKIPDMKFHLPANKKKAPERASVSAMSAGDAVYMAAAIPNCSIAIS